MFTAEVLRDFPIASLRPLLKQQGLDAATAQLIEQVIAEKKAKPTYSIKVVVGKFGGLRNYLGAAAHYRFEGTVDEQLAHYGDHLSPWLRGMIDGSNPEASNWLTYTESKKRYPRQNDN